MPDTTIRGDIVKLDDERRLAFGWASVISEDGELVVDKQGDVLDSDTLEEAAYEFVLVSRNADEMHVREEGIGKLVESVFLDEAKMGAMGLTGKREGWWTGFKILDDGVWEKVKDGTYSMFSIRGAGEREPIEV